MREVVKKLLSRLELLSFDEKASEKAAEILTYLESRGEPIEFRDAFIAATALTNNYATLTRNTKHFSQIPNLKILEAP